LFSFAHALTASCLRTQIFVMRGPVSRRRITHKPCALHTTRATASNTHTLFVHALTHPMCQRRPLQLSLVVSANYMAQTVGCTVMGRCSDKYGRRPVIMACLCANLLSSLAISQASTLP
jgi:MFS family permease